MPQKIILEKIFTDQKNITDRVKTFRDACDVLCIDENDILPYTTPRNYDEISANAYVKLLKIVNALNEGWKPNWDDKNEYKYYPCFEILAGGSGFRFSDYICTLTYTHASAGVRLVFKTKTLAEYAGKQFIEIYKELMLSR